jgi:periplasmic protein TonB
VNQRRSSFVVLSVTAHAIVLGALLATSLLAPGLLPAPRTLLAWAPERVVQPVDVNLPAPARPRTSPSPSNGSPERAQTPALLAPSEAPTGIAPETGREDISSSTINRVGAFERAGESVEGIGIAERPPIAPPAPTPPGPQRLHQGVQAPRKIVDVAPRYPTLARDIRIEGTVILDVIIDEHGAVTSTRVLKSIAFLDQAAIDAVRQWKFTPARLNGEAIPIVMTVTVTFRLQ